MSFLNPYEVSSNSQVPEDVVITLKEDVFINALTLEPVSGQFSVPLPKQFGTAEQKIIVESIGYSFQILMAAAWGLAFLLQFWQSSFLYRFWPLYLTVQLLATLVMLDVSVPTNVTSILYALKNVLELNFVQRDTMLEIYENSPASYRAHEAGGALVSWFIPLVGAVLLIVLLMKVVLKHTDIQCYWCIERTFEFLFYSLPLRMMILTFLPFCIVASKGEIWCMVYCPLVTYAVYNYFIYTESHELNIQSTQSKFSTLYQELKTYKQGSVLYTPFLMSMRIVFVFFMSFAIFMLQFFGAVFVVMFTLCHLIITQPHIEERMTNLEIFNNVITGLCFYLLVAFSPYVQDTGVQYNNGWIFIGFLFLLFLVNIGQVIFSIFETLQNKSRQMSRWARAQSKRSDSDEGTLVAPRKKTKKNRRSKDGLGEDGSSGVNSRDSIQFLNAALQEDRKNSSANLRNSAARRSNELRPGQSFDFARDSGNQNLIL